MKEKIKEKINIKKIGLFSVIFIFISRIVLSRSVTDLDEIWNFNFARCVANGLIPYKDFNIILGPFISYVSGLALKIFGQEMLVTRFLAIILDSVILYMIYSVMTDLKIKPVLKYLSLILCTIIMTPYFSNDYNWATLLIILIILKLEIKRENNLTVNFKHDFILGLLAGISITIKQTTGLLIAICVIGYKILEIRKKEEWKEFIKIASIRLLGTCIPVAIMILFLIFNNAITDYIDYCILGISTFSNKISYIERLIKNKEIIIKILSFLPIINIISIIIYLKRKDKNMLILFTFSIVCMALVYPISDEVHFVIAIVPTIISFSYIISLLMKETKVELYLKYFLESVICLYSLITFILFIGNMTKENINTELEHFKYLPMSKEDIEGIKNVTNYIEKQDSKVYILDASAALYMIPIDRYNKNYDMFNKGNLGSKGEAGQIENLKNEPNKKVLIRSEKYKRNWQNPEEVRKYVKNNMTKIGEIGIYDIYE